MNGVYSPLGPWNESTNGTTESRWRGYYDGDLQLLISLGRTSGEPWSGTMLRWWDAWYSFGLTAITGGATSGSGGGTPQIALAWVHTDHLGTPKAMTDDTQTVAWEAWHDPFGKTTETVALEELRVRFPGQYEDDETGLHYNYFRDYDPETGRYVQSDPIGLQGGLNTYSYALANPIRHVDPTGQVVPAIVACLSNPACAVGTLAIVGGASAYNAQNRTGVKAEGDGAGARGSDDASDEYGENCGDHLCRYITAVHSTVTERESVLTCYYYCPRTMTTRWVTPREGVTWDPTSRLRVEIEKREICMRYAPVDN